MATCLLMASEYIKEQGQTFSSYCCTSEGGEVSERLTQNRRLNTHVNLSQQFLGSFPVCSILSRTTTKLFMKPSVYDRVVGTVQ